MIATILLVWYALGWVFVGAACKEEGIEELTFGEFFKCFYLAPLILILWPASIFYDSSDKVIWRKGK